MNQRRLSPTDLQSVAIDHSAIPPHILRFSWSRRSDSNGRPADYKSAALPTELHRQIAHQPHRSTVRNFTENLGFCQVSGGNPNPQVATALLRIDPVVVQVKPTLAFHPSGAAEKCAKLASATR